MKYLSKLSLFLVAAVALIGSGCAMVTQVGTAIGEATGTITADQAQSINRTAQAVEKTFQDITPEQEYYIGRAVAATVLNHYRADNREEANHYLNVLGQILAQASDRPETFSGYHFQIMDSDEINAFSAPGGFIMVSRGMLRCCQSEDALAAVLAHEIGHVQGQHGLRAIKKGRLTSAATTALLEGAKSFGKQELAELTTAFEGSITDISGTLMNSGYARGLEREADVAAVTIMKRVGYDPKALVDMLQQMKKNLKPGGLDFAKTHPDPNDRIKDLQTLISGAPSNPPVAERQKRFGKMIGNI
jgi:beta-barrel assembly-enhancing protease